MAKCDYCSKEMTDPKHGGCNIIEARIGGKWRGRRKNDGGYRCGDCGCANGTHHHPGCDKARCPNCGGQESFCDCDITGMRGRRTKKSS